MELVTEKGFTGMDDHFPIFMGLGAVQGIVPYIFYIILRQHLQDIIKILAVSFLVVLMAVSPAAGC
jgi:hypothetical protein